MIAQELAVLLLQQQRLSSLGLAVTCRGMKVLGGLLGPVFNVHLMKPLLSFWYGYNKKRLVPRLMRKVFTREFLAARHPTGVTYEEVREKGGEGGRAGGAEGQQEG
jgi:hypothetical protein